ncbi:unnamed protein product, partial [marine sediment metagenome]
GTSAELEKQIAAFKEAHCKTCQYGEDGEGCTILMRVYPEGKCYRYYKVKEEEEKKADADTADQVAQPVEKSEHEQLMDSLPCKDCQNNATCDRTFFRTDGQGGYVCDKKVSAGAREEVANESEN